VKSCGLVVLSVSAAVEKLLATMSSHAAKRSAWNDSLYLTEVMVFASYKLEFEPALLVV